jgi:hypothetical protein
MSKLMPKDVAKSFENFVGILELFRQMHGLKSPKKGAFEICTAMSDKLGRICRQVKHAERGDPKPDWPEGMTREIMGLLAYMIMLTQYFKVDMTKGMVAELESTIRQYASTDEKERVTE